MTESEYARFVSDIVDMLDEMKESGDYSNETLDEITWRLT